MRNLTDEQIDFIAEDIRLRGVFTQGLQENLLDHICCCIEQQDDERPFEEVYRQTLDAFGQSGLQGVQDETLYLINQPYFSKMKKIAYFSGTVASISLIGGALFKIMHWPGANIMLIIGTLTLTFLFLPYFFYMQFKEQTEKKGKFIATLGMITAGLLCMSALFKILHWPGALVMVMGFTLFFVVFLPLYMINGIRNPLTKVSSISNGFLFASIGGFMMLLSFNNPSKAVTDSLVVIHHNEEALLMQLQDKLAADSGSADVSKAVNEFIASTNTALNAFDAHYDNSNVGNGVAASPEDLKSLNTAIKAATNKFNASMSAGVKDWTPFAVDELQPSLNGSLRFQVVQLQCTVCTQAIGY